MVRATRCANFDTAGCCLRWESRPKCHIELARCGLKVTEADKCNGFSLKNPWSFSQRVYRLMRRYGYTREQVKDMSQGIWPSFTYWLVHRYGNDEGYDFKLVSNSFRGLKDDYVIQYEEGKQVALQSLAEFAAEELRFNGVYVFYWPDYEPVKELIWQDCASGIDYTGLSGGAYIFQKH